MSWYWRLVHKLPCRAIHLLCDLCGENNLCPKCFNAKFQAALDRPQTWSSGTTYVVNWPY